MPLEEPNLDHLTGSGEKVYGKKPSEEYVRKIVEENKKAEAELSKRLSEQKPVKPIELHGIDDLDWNREDKPEIEEDLKKAA